MSDLSDNGNIAIISDNYNDGLPNYSAFKSKPLNSIKEVNNFDTAIKQHRNRINLLQSFIVIEENRIVELEKGNADKSFIVPSEYDNYFIGKTTISVVENRRQELAEKKAVEQIRKEARDIEAKAKLDTEQALKLKTDILYADTIKYWKYLTDYMISHKDKYEQQDGIPYLECGDFESCYSVRASYDISIMSNIVKLQKSCKDIKFFLEDIKKEIRRIHEKYNNDLINNDRVYYKCPNIECNLEFCHMSPSQKSTNRCGARARWSTKNVDFMDLNFLKNTKPQGFFETC